MKKQIALLFFVLCIVWQYGIYAQDVQNNGKLSVTAAFNPGIELLNLIFHLTGRPEYTNSNLKGLNEEVDAYFSKFKEHEAVQIAEKLSKERGITIYDVANLAMAVTVTNYETLEEKTPFETCTHCLLRQWPLDETRQFLDAVRRFMKDTECKTFFEKQKPFYASAQEGMQSFIQNKCHFEWLNDFFGPQPENVANNFYLVPTLFSRNFIYGVSPQTPDKKEERNCIVGISSLDKNGVPVFDERIIPIIIHQFSHPYFDIIVFKNENALKKPGEKLFAQMANEMTKAGVNDWKEMVREIIADACLARYLHKFESTELARKLILNKTYLGYIGTEEVYNLLADYETHKKEYPTFESFFPRIIDCLDKFSKFAENIPKIVSIIPGNNLQNVDPATQTIIIHFDRPMKEFSEQLWTNGDVFPQITSRPFFQSERTILTIPVKLKPGWQYDFWLNSTAIPVLLSEKGGMLSPFHIQFKTRNN